ncbi:hypothetical protein [Rhizobium rhizogenes]|uniref:hypothetical protein n=1 Tax=Rhizobium rhizogenes TaxID=359 RepID=UPI001571D21E|nr:hypothetical protein [Rhizobium rhizogenes]NTF69766.1 hypothetical protein [Rhizobium rhizogenes]
MKHQYIGDINDYRKYALLRSLASRGINRIGVCWMLTPPDTRNDGGKLEYLRQPDKFRDFDPVLFDILTHAAATPGRRRLQAIEDSGAILNALYHNDLLSDSLSERTAFMDACASAFRHADLVFLDPDNGLEVSVPKGRKYSSKYLYLDEVAAFYASGKSLLVYQHFPRIERTVFIASCAMRLRAVAPDAEIWTFTSSNVVFLFLLHPESPARLAVATMRACHQWDERFIVGTHLKDGRTSV